MNSIFKINIMILSLCFFLYSCSSSNDSSSAIQYTGVTTPATITESNAADLAVDSFQGGKLGSSVPIMKEKFQEQDEYKPSTIRIYELSKIMERAIEQLEIISLPDRFDNRNTVELSLVGDCGGSASLSITLNSTTGIFSGTYNFDSYCSKGSTLTGNISYSGQITNDQIVSYTMAISSLTVTSGSDSYSCSGTFTLTTGNILANLVMKDNSTNEVNQVEDFQITSLDSFSYSLITMSGRFYRHDVGYVTISTPTSIRINSGGFWPSTGVMLIEGANSGKARLTVNSNTTYIVEADVDGDGTYEYNSGERNWSDV